MRCGSNASTRPRSPTCIASATVWPPMFAPMSKTYAPGPHSERRNAISSSWTSPYNSIERPMYSSFGL